MNTPSCLDLKVLDLVPFGFSSDDTGFYALRLERPEWGTWTPGQFVMIRPAGWALDMLWARPFSICRVSKRDLIIFFQVAGRGTARLTELKPGDTVHLWGPLGTGFAVEPETPTLLLAGGIGIAPFVGYVHEHPKPWNVWIEFGHRMPLGCYPFESISDKIMADSHHEQGPEDRTKFIAHIKERIADFATKNGLVLACGPTPFLRTIRETALEHGVRAQLSLENRMACGVGACLGCVCNTTEKWPEEEKRNSRIQTCSSGPVFWADQINFDE